MKVLSFGIQLVQEEDGGYCLTSPALPGCHSQGDNLDDAFANIREVTELTLEDMSEHSTMQV